MLHILKTFWSEEEGSILEYLILIAIVAVIAAFLFPQLREKIAEWFNGMIGDINCGIGMTDCDGATNTNDGLGL